jgi:hypothetical protein
MREAVVSMRSSLVSMYSSLVYVRMNGLSTLENNICIGNNYFMWTWLVNTDHRPDEAMRRNLSTRVSSLCDTSARH